LRFYRRRRRGEGNLKRPKIFGSKKERPSSEEFLEGYDLLWENTAPVKYQNPERWREPPEENSYENK
jgi:hypothetical protein